MAFPMVRPATFWSEKWKAPEAWIAEVEEAIRAQGGIVVRGGNWDSWDLSVRGGLFGRVSGLVVVEEHGAGKQLVRCRSGVRVPTPAWAAVIVLVTLAAAALTNAGWLAGVSLAVAAAALAIAAARDGGAAASCWKAAVDRVKAAAAAGV